MGIGSRGILIHRVVSEARYSFTSYYAAQRVWAEPHNPLFPVALHSGPSGFWRLLCKSTAHQRKWRKHSFVPSFQSPILFQHYLVCFFRLPIYFIYHRHSLCYVPFFPSPRPFPSPHSFPCSLLASSLFLTCFTFPSCWRKQYILPKHRYISIILYGVTTRKIFLFIRDLYFKTGDYNFICFLAGNI